MSWPEDVGILAIEIYFPYLYVDQRELEEFDKVSSGKYTIGLGQAKMGFCSDREDINSLCLTVVSNLLERNKISPSQIGRLEVGTETIIDKSKSVKSVLMQIFGDHGNIEGVDTTNACYGGTNALFNAINWIESSYWDGRLALVVCGDIAVYASGNARPTGGAGAVALLLGPQAPMVFDRGLRVNHMRHAYDFYKPDLLSEYPVVDGKLSVECYLSALDQCYKLYKCKRQQFKNCSKKGNENQNIFTKEKISQSKFCQHIQAEGDASHCPFSSFNLTSADAFLFHSPYCKLVQKSLGRLFFNDFLESKSTNSCLLNQQTTPHQPNQVYSHLESFKNINLSDSYFNKELEGACMKASQNLYNIKTKPFLFLSNQVGNMYTPSLYAALASFIFNHKSADELKDKSIVMFSYGSGFASSMFSIKINSKYNEKLTSIHNSLLDLQKRIDSRKKVNPQEFDQIMNLREKTHHLAPYKPKGSIENLFQGTFYIDNIDEKHRRTYKRIQKEISNGKK